jgi:hypothetical protein
MPVVSPSIEDASGVERMRCGVRGRAVRVQMSGQGGALDLRRLSAAAARSTGQRHEVE